MHVCPPYSFAIISCNKRVYVVDTHQVSIRFGGDNSNGVVVTHDEYDKVDQVLAACKWLWRRLILSGANIIAGQTLVVLKKGYSFYYAKCTQEVKNKYVINEGLNIYQR